MEPGEREDDEQYPPAPLPQHEREWRHPSEIGQAAWVRNEPPLAIGRGLLVTTGVIGGLIGLAVLWTMLPATSDGGVTALSTVVSRVLDNSAAGALTRDSATLGAPVPTIQVSPRVVTSAPAVAVAIGDHRLLITTAAAVGDRQSVTINLPSGETAEARVLAIDAEKGLAVLAPMQPAAIDTFEIAPAALLSGDHVIALSVEPLLLTIGITDTGAAMVTDGMIDGVPEGTPVVDAKGRLVGLCSESRGAELVVPGDMASMKAWLDEVLGGTAWLGVHVNSNPAGILTVAAIDPQGPAAAAGIVAGDTISAIDAVVVTTTDGLATLLGAHFPGDVVTVTVVRADGQQVDAIISLGAHKPGM